MDIIRTPWILSTFYGNINVLWIVSAFCGYYPHFVDTTRIGHITSYLACNVCYALHSLVLVMDIIFGHITIYLARNIHPISHILFI